MTDRDFDAEYRAILDDNARRADNKRWIAEYEARFAPYHRRNRIALVFLVVAVVCCAFIVTKVGVE